ncbi:MAG: Lsr2 family protein [Nocardioidaceae bacterium]|jgi:hypothetical protein|nr:Lsr2 family protein [Nocardioidaceae bacterium]
MAQKVQVLLVDDVDGGTADESVQFGLDGSAYEIDLSAENAAAFRDALAPYVAAARRVGARGSARRRGRSRSSSDAGSAREIREWARENGYRVSERGRVPADVMEAYRAAH